MLVYIELVLLVVVFFGKYVRPQFVEVVGVEFVLADFVEEIKAVRVRIKA